MFKALIMIIIFVNNRINGLCMRVEGSLICIRVVASNCVRYLLRSTRDLIRIVPPYYHDSSGHLPSTVATGKYRCISNTNPWFFGTYHLESLSWSQEKRLSPTTCATLDVYLFLAIANDTCHGRGVPFLGNEPDSRSSVLVVPHP